jgi:hypothetical protein
VKKWFSVSDLRNYNDKKITAFEKNKNLKTGLRQKQTKLVCSSAKQVFVKKSKLKTVDRNNFSPKAEATFLNPLFSMLLSLYLLKKWLVLCFILNILASAGQRAKRAALR